MADESLIFLFGGDNSGLKSAMADSELMVDQMDKRFQASGDVMAGAPEKFAKASAQAFKDIFTGEESLAAYREKVAFSRMTDEEKLTALRSQAMALGGKINEIEGTTAEKLGLQLQYEQKKTEIFDINKKLITDSLTETAAVTDETKKHPGLLGMVESGAQSVKKAFHEMGITLHGAGIGLLFAEMIKLGSEAVKNAQDQRDEFEKLGKPISLATESLATFGDGLAAVKHGASEVVGAVLGVFTGVGTGMANVINDIRGISEAQVAQYAAGAKAAEEAEARIKKARLENNDPEKIMAAAKALQDYMAQQAFARLGEETQMGVLLKKTVDLNEQINSGLLTGVNLEKAKTELAHTNTDIATLNKKLIEESLVTDLAKLKTAEQLAVTQGDKINVLQSEYNRLSSEQAKYAQDTIEFKKLGHEMDAVQLEITKQNLDYKQKTALTMAEELEIVKLQEHGAASLGDAEYNRLQILLQMKEEKKLAVQIEELEVKLVDGALTPAEKLRLAELIKQDDKLKSQIQSQMDLANGTGAQLAGEKAVTSELDAQIARQKQLASMSQSFGSVNYGGMSDDALKGLIAKANAGLAAPAPGGGTVGNAGLSDFGTMMVGNTLRAQVANASQELGNRQTIRDTVASQGQSAAVQQYGDQAVANAMGGVSQNYNGALTTAAGNPTLGQAQSTAALAALNKQMADSLANIQAQLKKLTGGGG